MAEDISSGNLLHTVEEFVNREMISQFVYQLAIMVTGFIILVILRDTEFEFQRTVTYMGLWFVLVLLLQVPEPAALDVSPFEENPLLDT